jgi:uncharacterized protein
VSLPGSRRGVCVVLHDVADATLADCERTLAAVQEVAPVPLTLLAVPQYHGRTASRALEQWLDQHQRQGAELALHGLVHLDAGEPQGPVDWLRRRFYTRGEAEFWGLNAAEATWRLAEGAAWFQRNGWPLSGFVAPAWLLGPGAWQALRHPAPGAPRFTYTATLRGLHPLQPGIPRLHSRGVVYSSSSAWRRGASVAWAAFNQASQAHAPVLRLELHPADGRHRGIRRSWQRALEAGLKTREAGTVASCLARWQAGYTATAGLPDGVR